jgi:cyclase
MGVEKVAVSSAAVANPELLTEMAAAIGRQSVVAVLDIRKKSGIFNKGIEVCARNATVTYQQDPLALAIKMQEAGAGEIVVNSVDLDGSMQGYDLNLAVKFRHALKVPITFLGGAGSLADIEKLVACVGVVGAAAGSLFVFKGKYRAVLINYPTAEQKNQMFLDYMVI